MRNRICMLKDETATISSENLEHMFSELSSLEGLECIEEEICIPLGEEVVDNTITRRGVEMSEANKFEYNKIDANCFFFRSSWDRVFDCCQKLNEDWLVEYQKEIDNKGPRRCCVCGDVEEYAEPDKEGKVYCYKHCSW